MTTNDQVTVLREALQKISETTFGNDGDCGVVRIADDALFATERAATQPAGDVAGILTWKDRARIDKAQILSPADVVPYMEAELKDLRNRLAAPISEDTAKAAAGAGAPFNELYATNKSRRPLKTLTPEDIKEMRKERYLPDFRKMPEGTTCVCNCCGKSCSEIGHWVSFAICRECYNAGRPTDMTPAARTPASVGSEAKGEAAGSVGELPPLRDITKLIHDAGVICPDESHYNVAIAAIEADRIQRIAAAPERSGKVADEGQQGTLGVARIVKNAILGNSHPCEDGYLMFISEDEVLSVGAQVERAIASVGTPAGNSSAAPSDALDFTKPMESFAGRPVKHICDDVIEYKSARVCVNKQTGVVYSSPYVGLNIRNVAAPAPTAESVSVPEAVRIGLEAAFEEKEGWRTKVAAGVRALAAKESA